ncbi:DUF3999 family protein [Rhodoferax saidenbachensis]|uniref:DUF3999 domain-containing protein n=1 Tax=Rhodoferax saidenbachensis TaxID=1484693 RepID=A0ABU1ZPZ1_9BURK|nr:DUF3999 family protein [Rhodoferax saidenbachensis]MDR7307619.1 hypothetical protein [Rhodoferax saidenbachensis]
MKARMVLVAALAATVVTWALAAEAPAPVEFAWRGTLTLPAGSSLVRAEVPAEALLRMQSSAAHDLRVFNAEGTVVPYALLRSADLERTAPLVQTRTYTAYPLFATAAGAKPVRGAVEVRVSADGSAWVQWGAKAAALPDDAQPLQAALFDTRAEKHALAALDIKAELPRNALVHLALASSDDLQDWHPVPVKGPLFRFDGADAPASSTLELQQPLNPQGRYLRLSWAGQSGVKLASITGRVAPQTAVLPRVRSALSAGTPDGSSLSWTLPFATPIAALHLQATQDNTLLPLRISGRADATQLWRTLASTVVYRLDTVGQGSSNPPVLLQGASVRGLRVEASNGQALASSSLQASVEFAPLQVAFLASGPGPFTLAVGRANTASAAVDASLLGSVSPAKLAELPAVAVQQVRADAPDAPHVWAAALLPDGVTVRTALLWAVLVVGVLSLAGVAYALLRQITGSK